MRHNREPVGGFRRRGHRGWWNAPPFDLQPPHGCRTQRISEQPTDQTHTQRRREQRKAQLHYLRHITGAMSGLMEYTSAVARAQRFCGPSAAPVTSVHGRRQPCERRTQGAPESSHPVAPASSALTQQPQLDTRRAHCMKLHDVLAMHLAPPAAARAELGVNEFYAYANAVRSSTTVPHEMQKSRCHQGIVHASADMLWTESPHIETIRPCVPSPTLLVADSVAGCRLLDRVAYDLFNEQHILDSTSIGSLMAKCSAYLRQGISDRHGTSASADAALCAHEPLTSSFQAETPLSHASAVLDVVIALRHGAQSRETVATPLAEDIAKYMEASMRVWIQEL